MRNSHTTQTTKNVRNQEITVETLLPDMTLQKVADAYGITKQRVYQIITRGLLRPYVKIKVDLLRRICFVCGAPVMKRTKTRGLYRGKTFYCSKRCYEFIIDYDFSSPKKCKWCKQVYYPSRNWKWVNMGFTGYCSMYHYHKARNTQSTQAKRLIRIIEKTPS